MDNIKEILINYIPSLTTLIGFIAAGLSFLKCLKKSNLETIKDEIKNENTELNLRFNELIDLAKQLMNENRELKETNRKLLGEIKRIAGYEEE